MYMERFKIGKIFWVLFLYVGKMRIFGKMRGEGEEDNHGI